MKFPDHYRAFKDHPGYIAQPGDPFGAFIIPSNFAVDRALKVIANDGSDTGWEHVSVSLMDWPKKTPTWAEMCLVKNLFWDARECVVQFHPPEADFIRVHPGVLHLWRCVNQPFPMPPKGCV